jgi:ubiquitin C-terminal hydrolase
MKGIINIGNSCYLNSALQLLFNSKDFRELNKNNIIGTNINNYIDTNLSLLFNPINIKNIVAKVNNQFAGFGQEDSFEFIVYLLDYIDNIDKITHNKLYDLFGIQITINIKCKMLKCLKESERSDTELFLQLPLIETNQILYLNDLYKEYKKIEKLMNENAYRCDNCKQKTIARRKTITTKWPNNLIIILKRFNNQIRKDNRQVIMPLEWRHNYKLKGGIIHSGAYGGGHYTYFGKEDNKWYMANDSHISLINDIEGFINNNASYGYIYLYEKIIN